MAVQARFAAAKRAMKMKIRSAILRFQRPNWNSHGIGQYRLSLELGVHVGENPAYPSTQQSTYFIGGSEGSISVPDLRVWRHDGDLDWWNPMQAEKHRHKYRSSDQSDDSLS